MRAFKIKAVTVGVQVSNRIKISVTSKMDNPKLRLAAGHCTLTFASGIFELHNREEGKN
jgi:hypothetical protein